MRPQLTLALLFAAVLAGCGSTPPSPESVRSGRRDRPGGNDAPPGHPGRSDCLERRPPLLGPDRLDHDERRHHQRNLHPGRPAEAQVRRAGAAGNRDRARAEREDRALAPNQHRAGPRGSRRVSLALYAARSANSRRIARSERSRSTNDSTTSGSNCRFDSARISRRAAAQLIARR
jgi:hypothetical protein